MSKQTLEPVLDHAVIDVRDGIDDAAVLFGRLGFTLSPRGHHNLGSSNHLAIFQSNYLELFGWERGARVERADVLRYPVGLGGLVFRADDADTVSAGLANLGLPAQPPVSLSRPVQLPNGANVEARFRTVPFDFGTFGWTRTYFCEHFTPELVWREEWQQHANGACEIHRVTIQAEHPHRLGTLFATMFGEARMHLEGETCILQTNGPTVAIMQRSEIERAFSNAAPDLHARDEAPAVLSLRSTDLDKTASALLAGNIPFIKTGSHAKAQIVVPAQAAFNVTLEFVP